MWIWRHLAVKYVNMSQPFFLIEVNGSLLNGLTEKLILHNFNFRIKLRASTLDLSTLSA